MPEKEEAIETKDTATATQEDANQEVIEAPDPNQAYLASIVQENPHLAKNEGLKDELQEALGGEKKAGEEETKSENKEDGDAGGAGDGGGASETKTETKAEETKTGDDSEKGDDKGTKEEEFSVADTNSTFFKKGAKKAIQVKNADEAAL